VSRAIRSCVISESSNLKCRNCSLAAIRESRQGIAQCRIRRIPPATNLVIVSLCCKILLDTFYFAVVLSLLAWLWAITASTSNQWRLRHSLTVLLPALQMAGREARLSL